jgi:hypothetical protein
MVMEIRLDLTHGQRELPLCRVDFHKTTKQLLVPVLIFLVTCVGMLVNHQKIHLHSFNMHTCQVPAVLLVRSIFVKTRN